METESRITDTDLDNTDTSGTGAVEPISESEIAELKEASTPFIGKWNTLVSTTNWEKGRIICEWRESQIAKELPATMYSDEAWSQLVGSVTSQHVGRLRRVHQRFGDVYQDYEGVFWTHFHAAIDWDDAEMYLEGVVQNSWSVSQMRNQRWEAMGKIDEDKPDDADVISGELDEDFEPGGSDRPQSEDMVGQYSEITGPRYDDPDFGDEPGDANAVASDSDYADVSTSKADPVRPFENIADLPEDIGESFESFKLAILRHKTEGWAEISCEDVLASLDALKQLATAPTS